MKKKQLNSWLISCLAICLAFCMIMLISTSLKQANAEVSVTVEMEYGASLRVSEDKETYGLRFTAKVSQVVEGYEYHIIIVPEDYFSDDLYTSTNGNILDKLNAVHKSKVSDEFKTVNDYNCTPDDNRIIRAVINNIHYSNINRAFSGVAYVMDADGNITFSNGDARTTRTISQIAAYALMDDSADWTDYDDLLNDCITKAYNKAVDNEESATRPTLTIEAGENQTIVGYYQDQIVIDNFTVKNGDTELPELKNLIKATGDNIEQKDGVISLTDTDLASGDYELTLSAPFMNDVTLTYTQNNMNLFTKGSYGKWTLAATNPMVQQLTFNEQENATVFKGKNDNDGMNSHYGVVTLPIEILKKAQSDGHVALSFDVKASAYAIENAFFSSLGGGKKTAGIRIFASTNSSVSDYITWGNDANNLHRQSSQGNGVAIYKDVFAHELSSENYTTVLVNIVDFLALNIDAKYFAFVVGATTGDSAFYLRNTQWLDQEKYEIALEDEKALLASKNYAAEDYLDRWNFGYVDTNFATNLNKTYDDGAIKLAVKTFDNNRNNPKNTVFIGIDEFKYAMKLGFTQLSITYKVSQEKIESQNKNEKVGDFILRDNYIYLASNVTLSHENNTFYSRVQNSGATSYVTQKVNLSDMCKEGNKHLIIDFGGLDGSAIWIKEIKLIDSTAQVSEEAIVDK